MSSNWPFTFRLFTFATTILFSVIVTCLSADVVYMMMPDNYSSAVALAVSVLTVLTVALMLIIDKLRRGSIFSYTGVEIVWLTILWVLWLGSGSFAAWADHYLIIDVPEEATCHYSDRYYYDDDSRRMRSGFCYKIKAIIGFSFLCLLRSDSLLCELCIPLTMMQSSHGVHFHPSCADSPCQRTRSPRMEDECV